MAKTTLNLEEMIGTTLDGEPTHQVHHVIRAISKEGSFANGATPGSAVDEYIQGYLNSGWTLQSVHYLGERPEGYQFLWVLLK